MQFLSYRLVTFLILPLAWIVPAWVLGYLLLFEWVDAVGGSLSRGYESLPEGHAEQIAVSTVFWVAISVGMLVFQIIWVWRPAARSDFAPKLLFWLRMARSVLAVGAVTIFGSFALWAAVDLALLRIGHEGEPSEVIGWFMLGGVFCLLVWVLLAALTALVSKRA